MCMSRKQRQEKKTIKPAFLSLRTIYKKFVQRKVRLYRDL